MKTRVENVMHVMRAWDGLEVLYKMIGFWIRAIYHSFFCLSFFSFLKNVQATNMYLFQVEGLKRTLNKWLKLCREWRIHLYMCPIDYPTEINYY